MRRCLVGPLATVAVMALLGVLGGCSNGTSSSSPSLSPSLSASPISVSITPSPATDWQQTKTYTNQRFGFSFQYDPTRFTIKEVESGPSGGLAVYAYVVDAQGALGDSCFFVSPIQKPSYLDRTTPSDRQLHQMARQFFGPGQPAGSQLAKSQVVRLGELLGVASDGTTPASGAASQPLHGRGYVLCGSRYVWELTVAQPQDDWPSAWPVYEGIVASFRAD
jgi:hypothetical protein